MEQCNHGGVKAWCPICKSMPKMKQRTVKNKTMTLSEFINKTEAMKIDNGFVVIIPLYNGSHGKLFIKDSDSEFGAKESAFIYLINFFEQKYKDKT